MPVSPFDSAAYLASPLRVDWLVGLAPREREDYERAISEKAVAVLHSARFTWLLHEANATEVETKVWLETALNPGYVAVHYEARLRKHYFLLMDASGRERLAALVFGAVPSVTGAEAEAESALFFETFEEILGERGSLDMIDAIEGVQAAYRARGDA